MEYMLIYRESAAEMARRDHPTDGSAYWGAWMAYIGALQASGVDKGGNGLQLPHTGTTVRVRQGKREVQDGPFADTREELGGYSIIDVASLDEALEWAARAPSSATGSTEVRPVLPPMPAA